MTAVDWVLVATAVLFVAYQVKHRMASVADPVSESFEAEIAEDRVLVLVSYPTDLEVDEVPQFIWRRFDTTVSVLAKVVALLEEP